MPKIIDANYAEQYLLPPSVEDWVGKEHPARFVRDFVGALDLDKCGFEQPEAGDVGRPAYAPALLLRLWLLGYMLRIRSTRRLEAAARDQMAFVWLCGNQAPDHNSLWRFWKANRKALRVVFRQSVRVAMDMKLVGVVLQAIDGTKLAAVSSGEKGWDEEALGRELGRLDQQLAELEVQVQASGEAQEALQSQLPPDALEQLARTGQLRAAVAESLARVQAGEAKHSHPLEPEAQRMKVRGGGKPFAYNAQACVDSQARIITAAEVTSEVNDDHLAQPLMERAEVNTGGASAETVSLADGGYACSQAHLEALQSGRELLTPLPSSMTNRHRKPFHTSRFHYDASTNTVTCPIGRCLPQQRLRRKGSMEAVKVFRSAQVCAGCPVRAQCTKDRHGRTIDITPGHHAVEALRLRLEQPDVKDLLAQRGRIVETVFAWIKSHDHFRRFTAKGLDNVRTQWAMLCTARNLHTMHGAWRNTLQVS